MSEHSALQAIRRMQDRYLMGIGFDAALRIGRLGSYLSTLESNGFAKYGTHIIARAKMSPRKDPMKGGMK